MRPTAQRAVSRRRLISERIFSMSGPLSYQWCQIKTDSQTQRSRRGNDDVCVSLEMSISPQFHALPGFRRRCATLFARQHQPSCRHRDGVTSSRFGATVLVWSLPNPSAFLVCPHHAADVNLEARARGRWLQHRSQSGRVIRSSQSFAFRERLFTSSQSTE